MRSPARGGRPAGAADGAGGGGPAGKSPSVDRGRSELDDRDEKLPTCASSSSAPRSSTRPQLERIAGMTAHEAREQLMAQVIDDAKRAAMAQVREIEQRAREEGEERARKIVTIAIQRVASEQTAESTVSVFALPSEDMKGRIIGREGRNIRAFEADDGREPHHRRHAGGRRAVVLRPGAARGGPDDAREARRRRPDPPGADRGDARALAARDRRADPPRGRGRGRRGRASPTSTPR